MVIESRTMNLFAEIVWFVNPWRYKQLIYNWVTSLFLKYLVLPTAVRLNDEESIRNFVMTWKIEQNRNLMEMFVFARVPLRLVINWAMPKIVRMMLKFGFKPNHPRHDRVNTPLHLAVQKGDHRLKIARMLLDHGADVHAVDQHGCTPLHWTLRLRYPIRRMVKLLVSKGAKVDSVANNSYRTPLLTAVTFNQPLSVVKILVEHGANPIEERTLKDGETVLHKASVHQRSDLIDYFLDLGMDVNVKSKLGLNLVSREVVKECKPEFFKFLMSRNARVDRSVLRWMLNCSSNVIKHDKYKLQLYILYVAIKSKRPFYQVCQRLRLDFNVINVNYVKPMLEMIALYEFLTNDVDLSNENFLALHPNFKYYLLDCKRQLERMKHVKMHGGVTLLNLLTADVTKISWYLRNRTMAQALGKTRFRYNYCIYSPYLEIILRHVRTQNRLEEKTAARLAQLKRLDHHLCATKIATFLEPQDMRMFLSCFRK